jgi:hypothetical protein
MGEELINFNGLSAVKQATSSRAWVVLLHKTKQSKTSEV